MEHISLNNNDHEYDKYSYMEVSIWINKLFEIEFKGREILIMQIENSKYILINGEGFISIKFFVDGNKEKSPYKIRVPIEMIAYQKDRHPIMFLLHVLEGVVDELEIYTADGSLIEEAISIHDLERQVANELKY